MQAPDNNKRRMQSICESLATGDGRPFVGAMRDDFRWTIVGRAAPWAKTYEGKAAVVRDLLRPLMGRFEGTYTNKARRIVADDDIVVVECKGHAVTKAGVTYDNDYCLVCRFEGGALVELTEYMDTQFALDVLGAEL